MSLQTQMAADVATVFLNTAEHATTINYEDHDSGGATTARGTVTVVVENRSEDIELGQAGNRNKVFRAVLYTATANFNDTLKLRRFDVAGDGKFWSFDEEQGGVRNDHHGMISFPVIRRERVRTQMPDYLERG